MGRGHHGRQTDAETAEISLRNAQVIASAREVGVRSACSASTANRTTGPSQNDGEQHGYNNIAIHQPSRGLTYQKTVR